VRTGLFVVFWLWLAVSLGVYGLRIWRRFTQETVRRSETTSSVLGQNPVSPPVAPPVAPPLTPPVAPPMTPPTSPPPSPPVTPTASGAAGGRGGLFASAGPTPLSPAGAGTGPKPTVAEVLTGVRMPCDLVPLVIDDSALDPHRVTFVTTGVSASEVGAAVGDELERLGFTLGTTSNTQALAERDGQQMVVTLVPAADQTVDGSRRVYPTVPPGSVVVEFRT
jgi:hypothetical protein